LAQAFARESGFAQPRLFSNRDLRKLILPLVIEQLLSVTIGLADTVMVAKVGEAAVSGVSLVDTINILFTQFFAAIATGGAVVVAQYLGRRDDKLAGEAARQLIWSSTLMSLLLMTVLLVANKPILATVYRSVDPQVMSNAGMYFAITLLSYPFLATYNAGAALFRSMGNSRVSMNISIGMNFINVAGNALLIYVFGWGTAGAATATVISRIFGATAMMIAMTRGNHRIELDNLWRVRLHWPMIKRILRIGIPSGVEGSVFQVGKVLVASLIASLGTAATAANAIVNTISSFMLVPGGAIGLATITVVGQCMGAQDHRQASWFTKRLLGIVYIAEISVGVVLYLAVEPMVGLFNLSPAAAAMAVDLAKTLYIVNSCIWPLAFTLPQALRASGDVRFTMFVSILAMWLVRIGGSYLLALNAGLGLQGVWLAMYLDWVVRAVSFVIRFASGRWKNKKVV